MTDSGRIRWLGEVWLGLIDDMAWDYDEPGGIPTSVAGRNDEDGRPGGGEYNDDGGA
jgi:hypothetical protein